MHHYRSLLHIKLTNLIPKQEVSDEWEQNKECKKMIQEKTKQGKKWLQLKTRISWNTHINKRNQANKNQL